MYITQGRFLHSYLIDLQRTMQHEIETAPENALQDFDLYGRRLIEKYSVNPITLHLDRETISTSQKTVYARELPPNVRFGRGLHDGQQLIQKLLIYHLPFSGEGYLFDFDPTHSCRVSLPKFTVNNGEICFEVALDDNQPDEATKLLQAHKNTLQQQVAFINSDLAPYNTQLKDQIINLFDKRKLKVDRLSKALANIGIPLQEPITKVNDSKITSVPRIEISQNYYSVALSYGGLDESIATKLNQFLLANGIKTWFYPENAFAGEKLHRMMSNMIRNAERVIILCSKTSLQRSGVLNELERTLEREAREGGSAILIPIALDDYVFNEWMPNNPDLADQIRTRNIVKINGNFESDETQKTLQKLLSSLEKTKEKQC